MRLDWRKCVRGCATVARCSFICPGVSHTAAPYYSFPRILPRIIPCQISILRFLLDTGLHLQTGPQLPPYRHKIVPNPVSGDVQASSTLKLKA